MSVDLAERIKNCDTLSVLPDIAARVIDLHNQDDVYAAQVASVVGQDPALSARVLTIANSSFFPVRREVTNINQAVAMLGVNLTLSVALSAALIKMLRDTEPSIQSIDHDYYWRKSILGALVASELGQASPDIERGDAYVAALLQDVGVLAMSEVLADQYNTIYNTTRSHYDLIMMERRNWGIDHAEAGILLLEQWQLPGSIVEVVRKSHDLLSGPPPSKPEQCDLVYVASVASIVAEQWLSEQPEQDSVNSILLDAISCLGEENYSDVIAKVIDGVPSASTVFNVELLSQRQIDKIA